jgi:hypothetical protein
MTLRYLFMGIFFHPETTYTKNNIVKFIENIPYDEKNSSQLPIKNQSLSWLNSYLRCFYCYLIFYYALNGNIVLCVLYNFHNVVFIIHL